MHRSRILLYCLHNTVDSIVYPANNLQGGRMALSKRRTAVGQSCGPTCDVYYYLGKHVTISWMKIPLNLIDA